MSELLRPGGLRDQITECQRLARESDPSEYGDIEKVNTYCAKTSDNVHNATTAVYQANADFGWYDITHPLADAFPPQYLMGFLNQAWVQKALGVPVNHSAISVPVYTAFSSTGDGFKGGLLDSIAYVLDHGVKVALFYGDRDYACNWIGGESSSLRIPWASQKDFARAGYTPLVLSPVHSGGLTRQFGNLSFTRVYQAGHLVPSYQPEAAYEIFMRALFGRDIATGELGVTDEYQTEGPPDTWWMKSEVLPAPKGECYVLSPGTCSEEERGWLKNGTAVVKDWIVVGKEEGKSEVWDGNARVVEQVPLSGRW